MQQLDDVAGGGVVVLFGICRQGDVIKHKSEGITRTLIANDVFLPTRNCRFNVYMGLNLTSEPDDKVNIHFEYNNLRTDYVNFEGVTVLRAILEKTHPGLPEKLHDRFGEITEVKIRDMVGHKIEGEMSERSVLTAAKALNDLFSNTTGNITEDKQLFVNRVYDSYLSYICNGIMRALINGWQAPNFKLSEDEYERFKPDVF